MATADQVLCKEGYGSSRVKKKYVSTGDGRLVIVDQSPTGTSVSHFFRVSSKNRFPRV